MNDSTKPRSICELLRLGPYQREGCYTRSTMEAAADAIEQLLEAARYAVEVIDHDRGKQARLRACARLQAAIANAEKPQE